MRKLRFFQKEAYISVDFYTKKVEVVKMKEANEETDEFALVLQNAEGVKKEIYFDPPEVQPSNAILEELETFADAIENDSDPHRSSSTRYRSFKSRLSNHRMLLMI